MKKNEYDLIIIGGGVMGLCTAYYASRYTKNILIIERYVSGHPQSASGGLTRSIRNDYLDPFYSDLAYETQTLWSELEQKSTSKFFIKCGVLNIAQKKLSLDISQTYAKKSFDILQKQLRKSTEFTSRTLKDTFPQFVADYASLDIEAGFLYLPTIMSVLISELKKKEITLLENTSITAISQTKEGRRVLTNNGEFTAKKMVITTGIATNSILDLVVEYPNFRLPLSADRPMECSYYIPQDSDKNTFSFKNFPVFAYLDIGIYGHPIVNDRTQGVKIGYFKPPGVDSNNTIIKNIDDFVKYCIPSLSNTKVLPVTEVDQCSYDMTPDNDFIVGQLPYTNDIWIGAGFCGTGFKFAPSIGKILAEMLYQKPQSEKTRRFDPRRFMIK